LAELHEEDEKKDLAVVATQNSILLVRAMEVDWRKNSFQKLNWFSFRPIS
jgi:hypothetical protein